jgi:hypothetical protein
VITARVASRDTSLEASRAGTGGRTPVWLGQASTGKQPVRLCCVLGRRAAVAGALRAGGWAGVRVWPALPVPGDLVRLPLPCPPQLIELSGYTGAGRLVPLWWSPYGDELMISDGTLTETGRCRGWLCFCGHPLACLFLEPYRLGDADDEGEHRLLVDRYLGTLEVGLARDVEQLLATQPSELSALTAHLSPAETEALLQRLLDVQSERERAKGPRQLDAEARAVWQREQGLLKDLTELLDDAQAAVFEALPPPAGADAGQGGGDDPTITEVSR